MPKRTVTIIYRSLPIYRIPFFEALRPALADRGIDLNLIYGAPLGEEQQRHHTGHIAWAHPIKNRQLRLGSKFLVWQPCVHLLKGSDLVVVEQSSRLLLNYPLLAAQYVGGPSVAFWGHGVNLNTEAASRSGEAIKRAVSRRAHWWFAYTDGTARIVQDLGFPAERITVLNNTIDTSQLLLTRSRTTGEQLAVLRRSLGLRGRNVGIYAGGFYREKRPDFMVAAAQELRARIPDFELILIGAGPEVGVIAAAAAEHNWIKYVGTQFGAAKVPYFMLAKVMLIPGWVGLGIVDAFVFETPLVAIAGIDHAPEIEYLRDGENGVLLEGTPSPAEYASAVAEVLRNPDLRLQLRAGCRAAAEQLSMANMVARFSDGVVSSLGMQDRSDVAAMPSV